MHSDCTNCPYHDSCLEKACVKETRHELDTDFTVNVIAHELVLVKDCPMHGGDKRETFPKDIKDNCAVWKKSTGSCCST